VGTTVSGRDLPIEGIESSVGLYINTLPLVVDWENQGSILSQLHHIQDRMTGLNTHSFADLAKLQRGGERLFHSLMIFENYPVLEETDNDILSIVERDSIEKVDYPLNILAYEADDKLTITLQYDGKYLSDDRAASHIRTMEHILGYVREDVSQPHHQISLLQPEEYKKVIYDWNKTDKEYPKDKTIHELFEEQARQTPDNIALVYEGEQLTYKELNEKSNQLARYIRKQYKQRTGEELKPDTLIPLFLERSLETIVGILGVLKAGGAYVPMDPEYPKERIDYLLADTKAELLLTQQHLIENGVVYLPPDKALYVDLAEALYQEEETTNLPLYATAKRLAYVIYTSGTTGKPKGVMIEHPGVINLVLDQQDKYNAHSSDRILLFSNYVFDASVEQMFLALLSGATLVVIDSKSIRDGKAFNDFLERNHVSQIDPTPSYLSSIDLSNSKTLKRLVFGGEHLPKQLFDRYSKVVPAIFNTYGPTETSITSLVAINSHLLSNVRIQNVKIYVLDQNSNPVPIGVTGELYIGGAGLARGYLHNETLTKERFINNPFATEADKQKGYTRLYKTGDLVRWLPDGNLEYLGRSDDQVKIRGYRIELGEIEHALQQIPGIKQSCVLTRERETASGKSKYLVGYYVVDQGASTLTSSEIEKQLSALLPEYMVPGALVALESFPLTINGKLDKRALPDPDFVNKESLVAPTTEIERALSKIWAEVLGLERVGVEDNFFRIGGDSILAIRLTHQMRKLLGCEVKVADVFKLKNINNILNNIELPKITEDSVEWEI
jgi:amino acid adenylation domain-containing protein